MLTALKSAVLYFLIVYAAAFALGTVRTLVVAPALGEGAAVALELPILLAVSWFGCGFVLRRLTVPALSSIRLAMGGMALVLVLISEAALSVLLASRTLSQHFALYQQAPALLGLSAQVVFALLPLVRIGVPGARTLRHIP